jgi:hypothetical protein
VLKAQVEVAQSPATYEQAAIHSREAELRKIMFTAVFLLILKTELLYSIPFYGVRID